MKLLVSILSALGMITIILTLAPYALTAYDMLLEGRQAFISLAEMSETVAGDTGETEVSDPFNHRPETEAEGWLSLDPIAEPDAVTIATSPESETLDPFNHEPDSENETFNLNNIERPEPAIQSLSTSQIVGTVWRGNLQTSYVQDTPQVRMRCYYSATNYYLFHFTGISEQGRLKGHYDFKYRSRLTRGNSIEPCPSPIPSRDSTYYLDCQATQAQYETRLSCDMIPDARARSQGRNAFNRTVYIYDSQYGKYVRTDNKSIQLVRSKN